MSEDRPTYDTAPRYTIGRNVAIDRLCNAIHKLDSAAGIEHCPIEVGHLRWRLLCMRDAQLAVVIPAIETMCFIISHQLRIFHIMCGVVPAGRPCAAPPP